MLFRLAWGNVRRARRDYLVYLLTLTLGVTVFYAFNTISDQLSYTPIGGDLGLLLGSIMGSLTVFLACLVGFLMVYASNFIMRRRKHEFGLYQVLGMSRRQVSLVMTLETAIVSAASTLIGLGLGIGLSQLMTFFTASLFQTQIADFHFFVSANALLLTFGCMVAIFLVTLAFNLIAVRRARVVDLMSANRHGETVRMRRTWLSALTFVTGVALVGVAYARLLHDGLPMDGARESFEAFWITTAMVTAGTVALFFGLSGILLTVVQGARGLYWRGLNMYTTRQLASRVNTASFSMAMISMVLFLAITSVSTGMSIASVLSSNVDNATPADLSCTLYYYTPADVASMPESGGYPCGVVAEPLDAYVCVREHLVTNKNEAVDLDTLMGRHVQLNAYSVEDADGNPLCPFGLFVDASGESLPSGMEYATVTTMGLSFVPLSDYNRYLAFRGFEPVSLDAGQYLISADVGDSVCGIYEKAMATGLTINLGGATLRPASDTVDQRRSTFVNNITGENTGAIIVPDDALGAARADGALRVSVRASYLLTDYRQGVTDENSGLAHASLAFPEGGMTVTGTDGITRDVGFPGPVVTRADAAESANGTNGLISYLAIYIGFVLVITCAAILAIQQLSAVADATRSFQTLSEIGCDDRAISHSVLTQQVVAFGFPLLVGLAHSTCALTVTTRLVQLFGGITIHGAVGFTCAIFMISYGGYFLVTYLMSKGILRGAIRARKEE